MWLKYLLILPFFYLTACSHTYYVVRHAEKATVGTGSANTGMTASDPPLTVAGQQRAEALKDSLGDKHISYIFSTNTIRTKSTAEPLRASLGLTTQIYARVDSAFMASLKGIKKNTLIVGHSNTVDEIVNGLSNKTLLSDLDDAEYDNLFLVIYKKKLFKTVIEYKRKKYGVVKE